MADDDDADEVEDAADAGRATAAETVRASLVRLRGGAPFLSPADAAALVRWLDGGVPVSHILAALERAASKRHAERVRAPLQLRHAQKWVTAPARPACPSPFLAAEPGLDAHPLHPMRIGLAHLALDPAIRPLADALGAELDTLPTADPVALADAAGERICAFFDAAWVALGEGGRARYLARAAARLADFLDDLDETLRDALLEEHARGILRDEVPCLSLTTLLLLVEA